MIEVTAEALATHPFLHDMPRDQLAVLAEAASDVIFPARRRLFEDGGAAGRFWLIQSGCVVLDLHVPGQGRVKIDTIGMGELLGWSWLYPPYRWAFGAVSASPVEAFEFDGRMVRARCESDPALGYELTRRLARVVAKRLQATRVRLIAASSLPAGAPWGGGVRAYQESPGEIAAGSLCRTSRNRLTWRRGPGRRSGRAVRCLPG